MRTSRVATLAAALSLAAALAGCGSSDSDSEASTKPAPPASDFPSPDGRSLADVMGESDRQSELVVTPTGLVFHKGEGRYGFGVFTRSRREQVTDAEIALYVAKAPPPGQLPKPKAGGKPATKAGGLSRLEIALGGRALGPFPARIETLKTEPAFQSKTTSDDPDAALAVYAADVEFPSNGEWRIAALIKEGDEVTNTLLPSAVVGQFARTPRVGKRPPAIHTPTLDDVGGDRSQLTTRLPPDTQNEADFRDVLGKKPAVLLFATPQFCQSRVCGPVVDVAEQVKRDYGDDAEFIHMEVFNDNDPGKGVRPQLRAFDLPSEPWLFVVDRKGVIRTAIEGAFGVSELSEAVKAVTRE